MESYQKSQKFLKEHSLLTMWSINNHNDDSLFNLFCFYWNVTRLLLKKTLNYNLSPNKIQIPNVDPCCALQGDGAAPHTSAEERVAFSSMAERLLRKQPLGSTVFAGWVHGTGPHGTHRTGPVLDGGSFARGLVCVCVCVWWVKRPQPGEGDSMF